MVQSLSSRRTLLKASAAAAGVGLVGALSGCSGNGQQTTTGEPTDGTGGTEGGGGENGGGTVGAGQALSLVPARSNLFLGVDFDAFRTQDDIKRILNAGAETGGSSQTDVDQALDMAESQYGIDPAKVHNAVVFGEIPETSTDSPSGIADTYAGGLLFTDLDLQGALDSLPTEFTESTYQGTTIYTVSGGSQVAQVDGVIAFTSEEWAGNSVEDVIDVATGNAEAVSGQIATVYEGTREAPIRFAMAVPSADTGGETPTAGSGLGMTAKVDYISGSILYENGGNRGLELNAEVADEATATQFKQQITAFKTQYKQVLSQQAEQNPDTEELSALLEKVQVSQSGTTLSLSYEDSVDNIVDSIEAGGSMTGAMVGGAGSSTTGGTVVTTSGQ